MISIKIEGAKELQAAFKGLPKKIANKVLRQAIRAALKPVLAAAKANVPRDSGELAQSLVIRAVKSKKRGEIALQVWTDPAKFEDAPHAASVEYGDSNQAPQPFMAQSFAETAERAMAEAMQRIIDGVEHQAEISK